VGRNVRTLHDKEYLVCDYCNEHKDRVYYHERHYNYGFSRCYYHACNECHDILFGPFRIVDGGVMDKAYESIIDVINDRTKKKGSDTIDFYEATRVAYTESESMRKHFDSPKGVNNLNKDNKPLWKFTYRILYEEKKRIKL
jgi:hypothetical protein